MKHIKNEKHTIQPIRKEYGNGKLSPIGCLLRFIGYWLGFSGLYAAFAICPFCGRQGCPVGMASTGSIGLFFALCVQDWKRFFAFIRQNLKTREH